jgi:hypothetical protein
MANAWMEQLSLGPGNRTTNTQKQYLIKNKKVRLRIGGLFYKN